MTPLKQIVLLMEAEHRMVVASDCAEGMGVTVYWGRVTVLQEEGFWRWMVGRLHNIMSARNTTELCA